MEKWPLKRPEMNYEHWLDDRMHNSSQVNFNRHSISQDNIVHYLHIAPNITFLNCFRCHTKNWVL